MPLNISFLMLCSRSMENLVFKGTVSPYNPQVILKIYFVILPLPKKYCFTVYMLVFLISSLLAFVL